jgi:uncharacterized membrane protein YbhN (UPF0104 family)
VSLAHEVAETGAPAKPAKKAWVRHAKVVATLLVCVLVWTWLVRHADLQSLAAQVGRLPPWAWVLAGLGLLAGHGLRALRLQHEWRHAGEVPWIHCLRIVLGHNALVLMLPLRSGEAGYLYAVRRQWGVDWRAAGVGLLRWRLQDIAVLLLLAIALLVPLPLALRALLFVAATVLMVFLLPPVWRWLLARMGQGSARMPGGRGFWSGAGASAANWTFKVLANGGLLAALAGLPLDVALRAGLGGELAGVQPLQPPAGLGTYEAGIWLATGLPHGWQSTVVGAALAVHAFSLSVALVAAGLTQLALPSSYRFTQEPCP